MIDLEKDKLLSMWWKIWDIVKALSGWVIGLVLLIVIIFGLSAVFYILIQSAPELSPSECTCKE